MGYAMSSNKRNPDTKLATLADYLREHFFQDDDQVATAVKLGIVTVNGKTAKRSGVKVTPAQDRISVQGNGRLFVSRGGYKLQDALESFGVRVRDRVCLDVGASTGGFTDCLLEYGAAKVYAIDTGYGQLAWKLRTHPKVVCVERTNVRYLMPERLYIAAEDESASLVAVDVSFISIVKILPSLQRLAKGPGKTDFVFLVKPQFEAGKDSVARGGIVRNPSVHRQVLKDFLERCQRAGLQIENLIPSPLQGQAGNVEFLAKATWPKTVPFLRPDADSWIARVVEVAYG
jgi:23S rRNA (cytidine1920-2'-O)/16S rRNA (cytidine1409-2'-O)-methyltransferase